MNRQSYVGTGLWVHITHRFGPRWSEWLMAAAMIGWGAVMLLPARTFDQPAYTGFRAIFGTEEAIGFVLLAIGTARLIALWINGHRERITYWTRNAAARYGWAVSVGMFFAHALSGVIGVWLVFYPAMAVIEIVNGRRSGEDIGAIRGLDR
jgi:hypothetical protein